MNKPVADTDFTARVHHLAGTLPTSNYWSQAHFEDELEHVFRRSWINLCRVEQVPAPGDFLVQELHALGTSVLLVRGRDQVLRAFHNMCSHRGNRVEVAPSGNKSGFSCLFHGWMYDHRGRLVGVPQAEKFCTVDASQEGLRPIHLDVWGGFVYICLAPEPPCSLAEFMQPLAAPLEAYCRGQEWHLSWRVGVEANCNWKLPYDAFTEFYHFDALHPKSIGGGMSMKDSVPTVFEERGGVVGYFESYYGAGVEQSFLEPTPLQRLTAELGKAGLHTRSAALDAAPRSAGAFNFQQRTDWASDTYGILPHTTVHVLTSTLAVQRVWPIAVDRCYVALDMWTLTPPAQCFSEAFNASSVNARTMDVLSEDMSTLERVQGNLVNGPVRQFHYNTDEALVKGLQDRIQGWIDRGKAGEAPV